MKPRPFALPCGCQHDSKRWLAVCPGHTIEFATTQARWQADHINAISARDPEYRPVLRLVVDNTHSPNQETSHEC